MSMNTQIDLSKLCGRKLGDEEAARIREMARNLELRDDDAIWQLLAAMEYQRVYYEKLPEKIGDVTSDIIKRIGDAAEKEAQKCQSKLAESVVDEAKYLASKIQWSTVFPLIIIGIIGIFWHSALCMWAGFQLGEKAVRPIHDVFLIPWAPILFLGISLGGFIYLLPAIIKFERGIKYGIWHLLVALIMLIGGITFLILIDAAVYNRL